MTIRLLTGDCRELMRTLEPAGVDAVVCDPPYGLEFMGKEWDKLAGDWRTDKGRGEHSLATGRPSGRRGFDDYPPTPRYHAGLPMQQWHEAWAIEALRVLKPGGYLLAFGGTRTFHRLACAVEDAGFEIRDTLSWLYGSGFPKSLNVSKAIDRAAGAEREVVGQYHMPPDSDAGNAGQIIRSVTAESMFGVSAGRNGTDITAPATEAARQWEGWGTALKPAWEPIIMARKPLAEPTVAANVQRFGTGVINVDGCRITSPVLSSERRSSDSGASKFWGLGATSGERHNPDGRWPPNVCLDEEAAALLDEMSGQLTSGTGSVKRASGTGYTPNALGTESRPVGTPMVEYGDTGGASRFMYTAKVSREERQGSTHPTMKPIALMRWLVRMVTPPGGVVLDPFMGSGSTGVAASREGFDFIGMELDPEYVGIARRRIAGDSPMFTDVEVSA